MASDTGAGGSPGDDNSGLRQDWLRGWWTRVAPLRGERPVDAGLARPGPRAPSPVGRSRASSAGEPAGAHGLPAGPATDCPFCPGAESDLADILQEVPGPEGWRTRAVANRYPFLREAEGAQEVLVESRDHDTPFQDMDLVQVTGALHLYRDRIRHWHRKRPDWEVHLFRNQGRDAGTSRTHPHAQLVALEGPTPGRARIARVLRDLHAGVGRCALCAPLEGQGTPLEGDPLVLRTPHHAVHALRAPLDPCHLRVIPLRHLSSLGRASDVELDDLARLLPRLLRTATREAGTDAWNVLVHDHGPGDDPALHWHLELRPRVSRTAGFEQMTETGVCPADPVADAVRLRQLLAEPDPEPQPDRE